ncbi:MAG: fatty acid desaturase [Candidatus Paceibacterota bacterium]
MANFKVWASKQHWGHWVWFSGVHAYGLVGGGVYLYYFQVPWQTIALVIGMFFVGQWATSCGSHRLFTHDAYKASFPLKMALAIAQGIVYQAFFAWWVAKHSVHHARTDREGDPHSPKKDGMLYGHMGWNLVKEGVGIESRRDQVAYAKAMRSDGVIRWQEKWYNLLAPAVGLILPWLLGFVWGDPVGGLILSFTRLVFQYHLTWVVNSLGHSGYWKIPFGKPIKGSGTAVNAFLIPEAGMWPWHIYLLRLLVIGPCTWVLAHLTFGEFNHANHHVADNDYRLGRRWDQPDLGRPSLQLLKKWNLVLELNEVSDEEFARIQVQREEVLERRAVA